MHRRTEEHAKRYAVAANAVAIATLASAFVAIASVAIASVATTAVIAIAIAIASATTPNAKCHYQCHAPGRGPTHDGATRYRTAPSVGQDGSHDYPANNRQR